jgi:hypothetical protein
MATEPMRIGVEERRARLAVRHRLAPTARAARAVDVATDVVGLHGTDPASVYVSAAARMQTPELAAIERALYEDRELVRMLGMRRTMFVLPLDLAAVVDAACTQAIAARERKRLEQMIAEGGLADDPATWLRALEEETVTAVAAAGEATGAEISRAVPQLGAKFAYGEGKKWAGTQTLTTRVLLLLGAEGRIVRARPRGSWISSQYRWTPAEAWLGDGWPAWTAAEARVELVRRWLDRFGPGTVADLKWWTGWTLGDVRRALAELETVDVDLDGEPGLVLAGDERLTATPEPWIALLPALDPTVMGWAAREWYLGDHAPLLFDRSGNAGPTVWCDGRIVGGWGQRPDGEVAFRLFEDVGAEPEAAIEAEAARLTAWLDPVRITPRFRTPLERELSA